MAIVSIPNYSVDLTFEVFDVGIQLNTLLQSAGWTCGNCSNGTAVASSFNWGADPSAVGSGAWVVWTDPGGTRECLYDTASAASASIFYDPGGFVNTGSQTPTTPPTGNTTATLTTGWGGASAGQVYQFFAETSAQNGVYPFYAISYTNTSLSEFWIFDAIVNPPGTIADPVVTYASTSLSNSVFNNTQSSPANGRPQTWVDYGGAGEQLYAVGATSFAVGTVSLKEAAGTFAETSTDTGLPAAYSGVPGGAGFRGYSYLVQTTTVPARDYPNTLSGKSWLGLVDGWLIRYNPADPDPAV